MTTEIRPYRAHHLVVECADLNMCFICSNTEFNKQHEGIWNSRTMSFIPQPITFSDGTPVALYEGMGYHDHSGIYYEECQFCGRPTEGNRYCSLSCEAMDII